MTVERTPRSVLADLRAIDGVATVTASGSRIVVECHGGETKLAVLERVHRSDAGFVDFTTEEPSLQEIFSRYTTGADGRDADDAPVPRQVGGELT